MSVDSFPSLKVLCEKLFLMKAFELYAALKGHLWGSVSHLGACLSFKVLPGTPVFVRGSPWTKGGNPHYCSGSVSREGVDA